MKSFLMPLALLAVFGPFASPGFAQDKLDLDALLTDEAETAETEADEFGPGDNKAFTVTTDDDVTSLEVGDIYRSNKSRFKVTAIKTKGTEGGKFTIERIAGRNEPGRNWIRTSGLGPSMIVSRETLWDLYLASGPIMHAIAACMFITIVLGLNSLWVFRNGRHCPKSFVEPARNALKQADIEQFRDLAMREKGLFGHICRAMAVRFDSSTLDDIKSRCTVENVRQIRRLRIPLQGLGLIAAVAPLLGLLGTVIGISISFESVAFAAASASKAQMLAGGIRIALFTTVGGLCVAIPAMFIRFLSNYQPNAVVSECELLGEQFVHEIAQIKRGNHISSKEETQ